jgi:hypothetical protein
MTAADWILLTLIFSHDGVHFLALNSTTSDIYIDLLALRKLLQPDAQIVMDDSCYNVRVLLTMFCNLHYITQIPTVLFSAKSECLAKEEETGSMWEA